MQRRYYTLAGDRFDLDILTTEEVVTIDELLKLDETTKAESNAASDEVYLKRARKVIRENFPTFGASNRALSGAVGSVYRDRWYRRQLAQAGGTNSPEAKGLLTNIRVHPARPIHDVFLDSGISQADFARQLGISRSVMSRLVSLFSPKSAPAGHRKSEEPLSTTTLVSVLSRLGIASRSLYVDEPPPSGGSPEALAAPLTFRERLLLVALVDGFRQIKGRDAHSFAQRLARLFNTVNVQFIDSIVKSMLRVLGYDKWAGRHFDISNLLSTKSIEGLLDDQLSGRTRSERLFRQWSEADWGGMAVQDALGGTPSSSEIRGRSTFETAMN